LNTRSAVDGTNVPYPDASFDAVLFVDVLHHTADPHLLLKEATRVGKMILIKDHFRESFSADIRLRFMDWVANGSPEILLHRREGKINASGYSSRGVAISLANIDGSGKDR